MKNKKNIIISSFFLLISIIFTVLVIFVDVKKVGPSESEVGLASINKFFSSKIGTNFIWYKITNILGFIVFAVAICFVIFGIIQLIKRKSLKKVDKEIIALGIIYILLALIYIFFEKFFVNFRPIIMPNKTAIEPSFPSSHTMLACTILGTSIIALNHLIRNKKLKYALFSICIVLMIIIVVGRFLSGVHWFSDIIAGILYSATLISLYKTIIDNKKEPNNKN